MITIERLSYRINDTNILQNINTRIPSNQLTAIIGPNGAGKSTLLNIMSRLTPIQSGSILYDDINITQHSDSEIATVLAILSQNNTIHSRVTVAELLQFGRYPHHHGRPSDKDKEIVKDMLEQFDLTTLGNRYLENLSGGQRQRALIAMAFCQSTPFVLLDEPLNNLDMYHSYQLMQLIRSRLQRHTTVVVLHDINQAIAFADTIIAMKDGQIVQQGTVKDVITAETIKELFHIDVEIIEHNGKIRMF